MLKKQSLKYDGYVSYDVTPIMMSYGGLTGLSAHSRKDLTYLLSYLLTYLLTCRKKYGLGLTLTLKLSSWKDKPD